MKINIDTDCSIGLANGHGPTWKRLQGERYISSSAGVILRVLQLSLGQSSSRWWRPVNGFQCPIHKTWKPHTQNTIHTKPHIIHPIHPSTNLSIKSRPHIHLVIDDWLLTLDYWLQLTSMPTPCCLGWSPEWSYVPGWDCHGLPIEMKALEQLRVSGHVHNHPHLHQHQHIPRSHPHPLIHITSTDTFQNIHIDDRLLAKRHN